MFVCFEGIDGAGKTSVTDAFVRLLRDGGREATAIRKSRPDDHPELAAALRAMGRGTWAPEKDQQMIDLGAVPWMLYNAAFYAAIVAAAIDPALASGEVVAVDGWLYKFALRAARVTGRRLPDVLRHFPGVRRPDRVFLLDVPPEVAVARMSGFTRNELGNGRFAGLSDADAFVAFQTEVRASLLGIARAEAWTVLDAATASPEAVAKEAAGRLFDDAPRP